MALNNLNFSTTGKFLNLDQRAMAEILKTTQMRWGFEISEGERPADPIIAHKATPTVRVIKDQSMMLRPVAIPIGTVISALPVMSASFYQQTRMAAANLSGALGNTAVPVSGEATSNGLAAGYVANGMGHDGTTLLQSPIEDAIEAYGKLNLAAVIANGGVNTQDRYHAFDIADTAGAYADEVARYDVTGAVVTASSRFTRAANMPIGVVTEDIFVDDQGTFLNFTSNTLQKFRSFLTDWYIEVPYVVTEYDATLALPTDLDWYAGIGGTASTAYNALIALGMPLMFVDTIANLSKSIGQFVKSDRNGKYVVDSAAGVATAKTVQHIGRVTSIDNKFPKDLSELVMVLKDSAVGGTDTYGLPFRLFMIANTILKNKATPIPSPTFADIMTLVNSGYIGVARINLHVS